MDTRKALTASLALNLLLLTAALFLFTRDRDHAPPGPGSETTPEVVTRTEKKIVHVTNAAPSKVEKAFDWTSVESPDYREYIANLRAIGCPEETIRDIIKADVNKLFANRAKEMGAEDPEFKFWETGQAMFAQLLNEKRMERQQAMSREKRDLLKALLGEDVPIEPNLMGGMNPNDIVSNMLSFLSPEKQARAMELFQQQQVKMAKVFSGGAPDQKDIEAYLKMQRELDQQMAQVLTPAEFEQFQLTMSQTANMMRMQLDGFNPSEQEFRDIFKLRKEFDDEYGWFGAGNLSQETQKERTAAEKALKESIEQLLGNERYEDYEMASDYQFKTLNKIADRQGLGDDAAKSAWKQLGAAEEAAKKIRQNKDLSTEERQAFLKEIRDEAENALKSTLGEDGFKTYADGQGRYKLNGISRPQPAQPTAQPTN